MEFSSLEAVTVSDISAAGIPSEEAERLHLKLGEILREDDGARSAPESWSSICKHLLEPSQPFEFHQMMYYGCYKGYHSDPPPAWIPGLDCALSTNVGCLLERKGKEFLASRYKDPITSFSDFQEFSVSHPEDYWKTIFEEMNISFSTPPSNILSENPSYPGGKWLPGATLNAAANCLSFKGGSPDDVTIIWRDEGNEDLPVQQMTLKELREEVCFVANALDMLCLAKGSAIAIDMPMTVTAVVIYLAIVLAGYVVVSIADSFAPIEISSRLKISDAKAIFTQDFIVRGNKRLPLYSRVINAHAPLAIVIPSNGSTFTQELRIGDMSWNEFLSSVKHERGCAYAAVMQPADGFMNILFSSGTTGEPKAIPWTHATPIKAAADAWCHMDIRRGDVIAWPTNLGWMMGPWLLCSSLLNGAAMALYNGSPLSPEFAKFVQDAKVTMLGVVPSIVRAWKNSNCTAGRDWSTIRCFSSTGEASSVNEYLWLMGRAHYKPVIEYCGGTEIGGAFVTGSLLQPQALAAFSTPAMGCSLVILDSHGTPLPQNSAAIGEIALYPVMFGASATLLNADHYDVYFKGMPVWNATVLRRHGDEFERTSAAYYRAHGRADDTMNIGGIKISSIEIERICNSADDAILESAAIGVPPEDGGPEQLSVAVVLKTQGAIEDLDLLKSAFNSSLQKNLNPLFRVSSVVVVPSLPRTASNKVMRRVLRRQFSDVNKRAKF